MMIAQTKMSTDTKTATATQVEAETQDEIEQIMSEIEELQQEMSSSAVSTAAPEVDSQSMSPPPTSTQAPPPQPPAGEPSGEELEQDILREFSGDGDEPWLEETLAHLKADPKESGNGPLDDPGTAPKNDSAQPEPQGGLDEHLDPPASETQGMNAEEIKASQEIENLAAQAAAAEAEILEAAAQMRTKDSPEDELSSELDDLKEESHPPTQKVIDFPKNNLDKEPKSQSVEHALLSMTVKGNMALRLNYETEDQHVLVSFIHDSICIQLSDGTELKVPVRKMIPRQAI